jgi:hypothetical protein
MPRQIENRESLNYLEIRQFLCDISQSLYLKRSALQYDPYDNRVRYRELATEIVDKGRLHSVPDLTHPITP